MAYTFDHPQHNWSHGIPVVFHVIVEGYVARQDGVNSSGDSPFEIVRNVLMGGVILLILPVISWVLCVRYPWRIVS